MTDTNTNFSINTLINDSVALYTAISKTALTDSTLKNISDITNVVALIVGLVESKVSFDLNSVLEATDDIVLGATKIVEVVKK